MKTSVSPLPVRDAETIRVITARMREGDETAFTNFYENYCDRLFRYLIVLTRGNEDLARELLQTTMTKVVRAMRPFSSEHQFWAWLATIARHSHLDALRRAQRAPAIISLLPENTPDTIVDDADAIWFDALDHCMAHLSAEEQHLIDAFYYQGESHQSMAQQQNTTSKAVESKLARLRQKLRAAILQPLRDENT